MEKITIITRHFISNYGSILQAIATQEFFKKYSDKVFILDYHSKKESNLKNAINISKKNNNSFVKKSLYFILRLPDYIISSVIFSFYQKKYLNLTKRYKSVKNINVDKDTIYCSGSDQLWGYMPYNDIDSAYYLDFVKNATKISFSSSFGKIEFDDITKKKIKRYLSDYSLLTIRESSGCDFVHKLGYTKANNVLDPTLLIDRKFWLDFTANSKNKENGYLFVYNLHTNKLLENVVKKVSSDTCKKVVRVSQYFSAIRLSGKKKIMIDPIKFLNYIKNSDFVVTDSFHGLMFSLIFNKNFIIVNPGKTSSRIIDILKYFNLEHKFITNFSNSDIELAMCIPNYKQINQLIEKKRNSDIKLFDNFFESISKKKYNI